MSDDNDANIHDRALMIAVEARTLARQAHQRQDAMDTQITAIRQEISDFKAMVAEKFSEVTASLSALNTKVAVAAAGGAVIASGLSAVAIHYLGQ